MLKLENYTYSELKEEFNANPDLINYEFLFNGMVMRVEELIFDNKTTEYHFVFCDVSGVHHKIFQPIQSKSICNA